MGSLAILVVLTSASVHDIRTREVPDSHWVVSGAVALVMLASDPRCGILPTSALVAGSALFLSYMLSPSLVGARAAPVVLAACLLSVYAVHGGDPRGAVVAGMFALYMLLYLTGVLRGGADAKAMFVLTLAFPLFPDHAGLPSGLLLNPSIAILAVASVLTLVSTARVLARNVADGRVCPGMFSNYRVPLSEARGMFVWPVEDAVDGRVVPCRIGDDAGSVLDRLAAAGATSVLVTPMIPFMVPVTAATVLVLVATLILRCRSCVRTGCTCPHPGIRCPPGTRGAR